MFKTALNFIIVFTHYEIPQCIVRTYCTFDWKILPWR